MNLTALQDEVKARVVDTASTTRLNYWINRAYHSFNEREAWGYLETTSTGASPLTISDLRAVLSVTDTTNKSVLSFEDFRNLNDDDPTLTATGQPYCWYQSAPTIIGCYPTTSVSLSVRYLKVPTDLSSGSDTPLIPTRYHYALVEGACAFAYRDSDAIDLAQSCQDAFDSAVIEASDALNFVNYDSVRDIVVPVGSSTDW